MLTEVPITGPDLDWGPNRPKHDATVALPTGEPRVVAPFDSEVFKDALTGGEPLRPVIAWGTADRYALGWLLAYKAYIERSWGPAVPPRPLALVAPGLDHPNTAVSYEAFDIDIVAVSGEVPAKKAAALARRRGYPVYRRALRNGGSRC